MMGRTTRVAASSRTLAKLRTRTRTSVTARGAVHTLVASLAPLSFVFALLFSLAARAEQSDVQRLEGKISATGATKIYLNGSTVVGTNTIPDGAEFDNLVFVYTNAAITSALTLDDSVRANARILLVGGGGAGGSGGGSGGLNNRGVGGGGGAGGYLEAPSVTLVGGNYSITVGAGGEAASAGSTTKGGNGGSSLIATNSVTLVADSTTLEAFGGGGGGAESDGAGYDADGGIYLASGGGGSREYSGGNINHVGGAGMSGQGNKGGDSKLWRAGGGGGGAGTEGAASATANYGGNGGDGLPSDITGEELYYAGGGGGGTGNQSNETRLGQPGKGGGGRGAGNADYNPLPGDDGFGGGGGGGSLTVAGGNGGCGTVIIRITQLVETNVDVPTIPDKTYNKENQVALELGIKYTYSSGTLNATNADTYVLYLTPGPDLEWVGGGREPREVPWKILPLKIKPPKPATELVYDGNDKVGVTYTEGFEKYCTFDESSVTNATNGGTYTYSVSLDSPGNTVWDDGTTDPVNGSWTIAPAKVTRPTPVTSFEYDGKEKTALEIAATDQYELTDGVLRATNGGRYSFTIELKGNTAATNYVWDTDPATSDPFEGTWEITPAVNAITSPSLVGWRIGTKANKPKIEATWGSDTAEYSYGFGDDPKSITDWTTDTDDITEAGTWILRAVIPATGNWTAATGTTTFVMWKDPWTLFRNWTDMTIKGTTTSLTNFVVPVRISEVRMVGFYYRDADSSKLVFVDEFDNLLPYDVDTWDKSGESVVWLKLPTLPTEGITVTMYWNLRDGQIAPANTPSDVWRDYAGVWHMSTDSATKDSTALNPDATRRADAVGGAGVYGGALSSTTSKKGPLLSFVPSEAVNNLTNGSFTVAFWAKLNSTSGEGSAQYLFARRPVYNDANGGYALCLNNNGVTTTGDNQFILYYDADSSHKYDWKIPLKADTWQRHDVVFTPTRFYWYVDGTEYYWTRNLTFSNGSANLFAIGGRASTASGVDSCVNGMMDEFRIRSGRVDANLIAAEYKYQSDSTMVTNGVVYLDGDKLDYWIVEPSLKYPDMLSWDVNPEKNVDAAGNIRTNEIATIGQLCYGTVTNYIYSLYDQNETYDSLSALTNAGNYRLVFTQADTNGYKRIEKIFDIKVTESKPYGDIVGNGGDSGRILLMNNHIDDPDAPDVDYQGWYDADNAGAKKSDTPTYWHHENLDVPTETGYNLKNGTESMLYAVDRRRLWHLVNCRHGNTFPTKTTTTLTPNQNYLPYTPEYSKTITGHRANQAATTRSTVGQLVMQNLGDEDPYKAEDKCAVVYSSCFTNGIGTIYFDAVNGWCRDDENYENYKIVVEIATSTTEGKEPIDDNSFTESTEIDPGTELAVTTTNLYGKLEGKWTAVPFRPFLHSAAGFAPVIPKSDTNPEGTTNVFALAVKQPAQESEKMIAFYRIVVPLDINGPVRFRIRRVSHDALYTADKSSFILLDNIIASVPADSADLETAGHFAKDKIGSQVLGWELMTSVPYPSVSDKEIKGSAMPIYHVNSGDPATADTSGYFASATMHYRWRYLNQTTNQEVSAWKAVDLDPHNGFKAVSPFDLPAGRVGDVEYWFESKLQAPYYSYVDYSSAGVIKPSDYTEERGVRTNKLDGVTVPTGGDNWFFRLREGKSDYSGLDIVFKRGSSAAEERVHMALAEDHVWRGFVQTKEDQAGEISYRIEALDEQTAEFAEYAAKTNYFYCKTDNPRFPVSDSLVPGDESGWSKLTLDAVTGYIMFQIDDTDKNSMALTVVHADYQNANGWSDAHDRKDSQGRMIFVGTSTKNAYKVGVSPTKQTFADDFSGWGNMAATNETWTFPVGLTDIKSHHMEGRTAYEPFKIDQNGHWDVGPGMWVARQYRDDRENAGVALQMAGYGNGYFQFTDKDEAPRGLESISFNVRLTQDVEFDDVAYYFGGSEGMLGLSNYTFVARTAFDLNANRNFKGNASLSVFANYLPNKGAYEARWEWLGNDSNEKRGQRLCLYRWNVVKGLKVPKLIVAKTNTVFNVEDVTSLTNNVSQRFTPLFISVSNDVPNKCTWVAAGIRRCGVQLGTSPIGTSAASTADGRNANWLGVCFKDTNSTYRLSRGTYGVLSANCPGVFARPEFSHTVQYVALGTGAKNNSDTFDNSALAQVSDLKNIRNCATNDLQDTEYPGWNIVPERNAVEWTGSKPNNFGAVVGAAPAQDLHIYLGTAGRSDWGKDPYKTITVDGFGGSPTNILLYTTKDCSMRFAVGDGISDIAVDSVVLKQWRGGEWNGSDVLAEKIAPSWASASLDKQSPFFTNFVFTSCWTVNSNILMSAKRSNLETPCAIRSPLMDYMANDGRGGDGYHRGIGLGMISIGYKDAQENAWLQLQIATNAVDYTMVDTFDKSFSDSYWTTITNYKFSAMSPTERTKGVLNTYLGLHSVTGMMRIVVATNAIANVANETDPNKFGDVTITSISCNDEPPVDVHSWWGWNLRTVGGDLDSEKKMFLNDYSTAPGGAGLSLALNNSVDENYDISKIDVADRESYIQHKPFVQTPTFTSNVVGEVSFKARKYASGDAPATVVLFGSKDASETDDGTWEKIDNAVFTVTNDWYETYSYKTDPGQSYKAFRLAVVGILGIQEDISGGGNARIPGAADPPVRVLLDQLFVSEAVRARMGFKSVGCFKSDMAGTDEVLHVPSTGEQPLCGEAWGVQCEIYGAQLASDIDFEHTPQVRLHWFDPGIGGTVEGGVSPWGYDKWKDLSGHKSALLSPATDSHEGHYVYRSSQRTSPGAVIGASMNPPRYVQYTLEVVYYTKGSTVPTTNWLSAADWEIPSWYCPLDFNASIGKGASFAAYNILDNVAPGWAWINEVNVFGLYDDSLVNTDAECQYIEIVQPPEADISGWYVRFLDAQKDNNMVVTNVLATFGMDDLTGTKDAKWIDPTANKVFRVIANQQARTTGKLKYEDGTLDGVWHIEDNRLTNMSGDKSGNTEITAYLPFAIQLVRSSGIVEHEIVAMGTNWWWDLPEYLARYHPTNTVNFLNSHMPRTDFLYVGVDDDGGEPCSLGVFQNNGSATNDWNNTMTNTPGRINSGNGIVQTIGDHPRPNPVNILVYMTVDGSHILQSLDGTTFTNEMFMLSVPKGSLNGTNVTYRVDPWYVVGSVTTNGSSAIDSLTPTVTTQPRQYVLSGVGKGASNNVTVVAMAAPDPRIAELGVDEDNEYRDAIVDWLEGGTDLFGNPFADIDGGEIKLAEFRTMNNTFVTNMTLTEMYWLDMDPTAGGLALLGGSIMPPPGESDIEHKITRPDGSVSTNIRMAVYMMITNENVALPAPTEHKWRGPNDKYTHWTPYVIRGREPKSNSVDYDDRPGDWPSVTFKPTGRLLNTYTSPTDVSNWEPLRLFVFQPDSFTEEGLSRIEIEDPFSFKPFVDWWNKHGPCGLGYFWSIDTRQRQMGVEILRQRNYYGD